MKALLPIAVFLLMVSIGMSLRPAQLVRNWRSLMQRGGWLRLIVATFLIPPAVAILMLRITPLDFGEATGLFLLGVVPGAPLTSRVAAKRGFDMHMAASYQVWGAVLVPAMIPLVVYSVAKLYDRNVWIPPRLLFAQIAEKQFAPLLIGVALVYFAAGFARKIQPVVTTVGNVLLAVMILAVLWKMRSALAAITPWVIAGAFALALASSERFCCWCRPSPRFEKRWPCVTPIGISAWRCCWPETLPTRATPSRPSPVTRW